MRIKRFLVIFSLNVIPALLWALCSAPATLAAGPWYVSITGSDSNDCLSLLTSCQTIAGAIDKAVSGDTVIVAAGTYTEHITITKDLTIQGAEADHTILDGNASGRVFTITAGSTVTMTGLTITNGYAVDGGGIFNSGTLMLDECAISHNKARGADSIDSYGQHSTGGGIYNDGTLTLARCVINDNVADGGDGRNDDYYPGRGGSGRGAGIYSSGPLTLSNCVVSNNKARGGDGGDSVHYRGGYGGWGIGGGIYIHGSLLAVYDCTINDNITTGGEAGNGVRPQFDGSGEGGGIYSFHYSDVGSVITLTNSKISGNNASSSGGGIFDYLGTITVINSTFSDNSAGIYGGGIDVSSSKVMISASTIRDNNAGSEGGGINQTTNISSTVRLTNTTVSSNTALNGGGIATGNTTGSSAVILNSSTIANNIATNYGGGLYKRDAASIISLRNTIVAGNTGLVGPDCSGTIKSLDFNLIQDTTDCTIGGLITHNITTQDPLLGPLQDNGGPTETHALLSGSPAIEVGSADCPPPDTDQRGVVRPSGVTCDLGAYEATPSLTISKTGPVSVVAGEPITYTLTITNTGPVTATNLVITDVIPANAHHVSGETKDNNVVEWTIPSLAASGGVSQTTFVVTATQTITNSDYAVQADGGYGAMGSAVVTTQITAEEPNLERVFLPVILK